MIRRDEVIRPCCVADLEAQLNGPAGQAILGLNPHAVAGDVVTFTYLGKPVARVTLRRVDPPGTNPANLYQPIGYWLREDVTLLGAASPLSWTR